jgi:histone-lysine N-methyltransferase SETMAR
MQGAILVHFTPNGETVNSQNYCDVLRMKLKPAIRSKRRRKIRKDAILLHDNVRPHTANQTVETVNELGYELIDHPPYSPDLASSDFHTFGPMKEDLRGRRFSSDEEVIGVAQNWLKMQPKNNFFFSGGIKIFVKRWNRSVKSRGITLKNNISFVSVYLQQMCFFKSRYFVTYPRIKLKTTVRVATD